VASPLSCIFSDNPGPVLVLSELSEKVLRSTPLSSTFSEITHPQLEQKISPSTISVTSLDVLQLLQINSSMLIFCSIVKFSLFHDEWYEDATRVNLFFCGIGTFVAKKLYWLFTNFTVLIYCHLISTFSARVLFHKLIDTVRCFKCIEN